MRTRTTLPPKRPIARDQDIAVTPICFLIANFGVGRAKANTLYLSADPMNFRLSALDGQRYILRITKARETSPILSMPCNQRCQAARKWRSAQRKRHFDSKSSPKLPDVRAAALSDGLGAFPSVLDSLGRTKSYGNAHLKKHRPNSKRWSMSSSKRPASCPTDKTWDSHLVHSD